MGYRRKFAVAALAAVALLTGCQNGEEPLGVAELTKTADGVGADGAEKCPLPYDIEKAAEAAGLKESAGPGSSKAGDGEPVATAEGGKKARPGEPLATNPGALVSCTFHIGQEDVEVHTVGTEKPQALSVLAPVINSAARMPVSDLAAYVDGVAKTEHGVPVLTKSGNVASVRLDLDGEGDAALLVSAGADGKTSMSHQQVTELARALGAQAK